MYHRSTGQPKMLHAAPLECILENMTTFLRFVHDKNIERLLDLRNIRCETTRLSAHAEKDSPITQTKIHKCIKLAIVLAKPLNIKNAEYAGDK
jgi:type III secretory pathway component EscT